MEWQNDWWSDDEKIDDGVAKWLIVSWSDDEKLMVCGEMNQMIDGVIMKKLMMAKWLMVWWRNYWCWSMISKMERQNEMLVKTN